MWCDALTDKVYKYLSTISKVEMKDKYTRKQLAIIKGNKIFAKSRFTFHRNKGSLYPSLPQKIKQNKSILWYIHDNQDKLKVENNSANVHAQTKTIQNETLKYGQLLGGQMDRVR